MGVLEARSQQVWTHCKDHDGFYPGPRTCSKPCLSFSPNTQLFSQHGKSHQDNFNGKKFSNMKKERSGSRLPAFRSPSTARLLCAFKQVP